MTSTKRRSTKYSFFGGIRRKHAHSGHKKTHRAKHHAHHGHHGHHHKMGGRTTRRKKH